MFGNLDADLAFQLCPPLLFSSGFLSFFLSFGKFQFLFVSERFVQAKRVPFVQDSQCFLSVALFKEFYHIENVASPTATITMEFVSRLYDIGTRLMVGMYKTAVYVLSPYGVDTIKVKYILHRHSALDLFDYIHRLNLHIFNIIK